MRNHSIFEIAFECKAPIREFLSHDEIRFVGLTSEVESQTVYYIAPSKEIAMAMFNCDYQFEQGDEKRQFRVISVKEHRIHGVLQRHVC